MKIIEQQKKQQKIVTDITCDCCGQSCLKDSYKIDNDSRPDHGEMSYNFEYLHMKANWGYYSNHDTETWEAHICESCVETKFEFVDFNKGKTEFTSIIVND